MQEQIERQFTLPGVSVIMGISHWNSPEDWACPSDNYVVCQRLSHGHASLRLDIGAAAPRHVYPRVHALGFMPSMGVIRMHPLGHPFRTLNCFFDRSLFETMTGRDATGWLDLAGSFMPVSNRTVDDMMRRIHQELLEPGFATEQTIEAATTLIAVEMARLAHQRGERPAALAMHTSGLAPWQLRRIQERVEAAPGGGYPRVQELAELCGISRSHLVRMFKASTGRSLQAFVAQHRLQTAQQMLTEDRMSIKEIAVQLGFCNPAHFTNAFVRQQGMTPSQFRCNARVSRIGRASSLANLAPLALSAGKETSVH